MCATQQSISSVLYNNNNNDLYVYLTIVSLSLLSGLHVTTLDMLILHTFAKLHNLVPV